VHCDHVNDRLKHQRRRETIHPKFEFDIRRSPICHSEARAFRVEGPVLLAYSAMLPANCIGPSPRRKRGAQDDNASLFDSIRRSRPRLRLVCIDWQHGFNSAIRFPYFHLTLSHASFQAGLRVYGRAVDDMAIANRKARCVPWALDYIAVKCALR